MNPVRLLENLGTAVFWLLSWLGSLTRLFGQTVRSLFTSRPNFALVGSHVVSIGFGAQIVVIITGCFTGAVFAAQMFFKLSQYGLESATGPVLSLAMCRELGAVMTGLMVAGWGGTAMAAEIGTMKVTEQVEALRSMGVHPVDYLVRPRVLGMLFSMPLLVAEATGFGILAGQMVAVYYFHMPEAWFSHQLEAHTGLIDLGVGMIKGFVFGGIIVLISCHQGLRTNGGAAGVGRAATSAFVFSSLAILMSNLFLTLFLNSLFPLSGGD